ncbi:MAG: DNA mismatch repair endonuclease MutL [Clostridiales bacterium]|nr:DNA mismatch repair endonuclease MutL [Clostridiales bacterium]
MGRIKILDTLTANAIKAGEVIERPVSVVKELFDNSADAGATSVKIEFNAGGIGMIRVTDNGTGMDREDASKAFLIHATSKLTSIEELYDLSTQGFRGEALASIASCSDVTLVTRQQDSDVSTRIEYEDGHLVYEGEGAGETGTVIEVRNLFKNIPARYKFLKKDSTEGMYICQLVEKLAIINPHISVKLFKDGKMILSTPGTGNVLDAIYAIHGKEIARSLKEIDYKYENYRITGYAALPSLMRGNRSMQYLFVNDRPVKNQTVTAAIDEAYKNTLMKGKFSVCFLMIYCPPGTVDVNVHPQKAEVRFDSDQDIFRLVYHGIRNVLFEESTTLDTVSEDVQSHKLNYNTASKAPAAYAPSTPSAAADRPTSDDIDASNKLLQLLSTYQPDVSAIAGEEKSEKKFEQLTITEVREEEENKTTSDPDIAEMLNADYIGTLFMTYIILQSDSNVYYVDQHAAHERVLYERFMGVRKSREKESGIIKEDLMVPKIIKVSSSDYSFISDNLSSFNDNGYEIEILEDREIALRAVPMMKRRTDPARMFEQVLTDLKHDTPDRSDVWYNLIQTTACKAAVKAGDRLSETEIRELISQLSVLDDPYHCAHGRPTFFKISRIDLEKRFKRIT